MTEEDEVFPVGYVKNFYFCEQIPYINLVLRVFEPETDSMVLGRERHLRFHAQYLPREIRVVRVETDVRLVSLRIGLSGVLDALVHAVHDELVPCEFKHSGLGRNRPPLKDVVQLAAYAMLVEDVYRRPVKRGVLFYSEDGGKHVVYIDDSLRRLVHHAVAAMKDMVVSEKVPRRRSLDKCVVCWYSRVCWGGLVSSYKSFSKGGGISLNRTVKHFTPENK
ncbi:MAG: CRISPR-associated protein Cas4 [Candidatus Caldarchaeum sp.]